MQGQPTQVQPTHFYKAIETTVYTTYVIPKYRFWYGSELFFCGKSELAYRAKAELFLISHASYTSTLFDVKKELLYSLIWVDLKKRLKKVFKLLKIF